MTSMGIPSKCMPKSSKDMSMILYYTNRLD